MIFNRVLLRHFILGLQSSFHQDRLGTNIGKTQKKSGVSLGAVGRLATVDLSHQGHAGARGVIRAATVGSRRRSRTDAERWYARPHTHLAIIISRWVVSLCVRSITHKQVMIFLACSLSGMQNTLCMSCQCILYPRDGGALG
jgi:hypothetical protein